MRLIIASRSAGGSAAARGSATMLLINRPDLTSARTTVVILPVAKVGDAAKAGTASIIIKQDRKVLFQKSVKSINTDGTILII
jgi:hypothetical protein